MGFLAAVGDSEENSTEQRLKGRKPLGVGFRQSSTGAKFNSGYPHALVEAMLFIEREERRELLEPPNQAPQGLRLDRPVQGDFSVREEVGISLNARRASVNTRSSPSRMRR
jgi:hypothetical protein